MENMNGKGSPFPEGWKFYENRENILLSIDNYYCSIFNIKPSIDILLVFRIDIDLSLSVSQACTCILALCILHYTGAYNQEMLIMVFCFHETDVRILYTNLI